MEVDVFPGVADFLPDAGLFGGGCRGAVGAGDLREADVGDDRGITNDANMGIAHGHLRRRPLRSPKLKVKTMKIKPMNEMAEGFRFKTGDARVAVIGVGGPIAGHDGIEEFFVEFDQCGFDGHGFLGEFVIGASSVTYWITSFASKQVDGKGTRE